MRFWQRAILPLALLALMTGEAVPTLGAEEPKRTSWGVPDLSGVWDYRTATPLQAPLPDVPSEVEPDDEEPAPPSVGDEPWADRGLEPTEGDRRSLIVDPLDGRLPPRTEFGEGNDVFWRQMRGSPEGPEDRTIFERCITAALIPLESIDFNNNVQIFQTPQFVVILNEMIHEARIVPITDAAPPPSTSNPEPERLRSWQGNSTGHWEGDTLVVHTRDFRDFAHPLGLSVDVTIVERFTFSGADHLTYEYTVTDPKVFERPWTARHTFRRSPHRIYEYACHEGNQSMPLMLKGARAVERRSAGEIEAD